MSDSSRPSSQAAASTRQSASTHPPARIHLNARQRAVVAVTFFSMFFGAGNLIFPPYVGALAGTASVPALIGFVISAVGLPILGVVAVTFAGGFKNLAGRVSKGFATVLGIVIILTIGPIFAIPRTASTSFEMMVSPFLSSSNNHIALFIYSLVFFALAFVVAQKPEKLSKVLGRVMGPVLLLMIVILFVICLFIQHPAFGAPSGEFAHNQFAEGFINGYQTMDLLAALYFGIVISANVRDLGVTKTKENRKETATAGVCTGIMLVVIYAVLGFIGMVSGSITPIQSSTDTGATVLTNLSTHALGSVGTVFIGLVFVIACFNVCTGLISTTTSFFHNNYPTVFGMPVSYRTWSIVFTVISFVIANVGLSTIITVATPILEAVYPIAIVLVILALLHKKFAGKYHRVYFWTILCTAVDSIAAGIVDMVETFGGHIDWLAQLVNLSPGASLSLGWILPAFVGAVIGFDISMFHRNWKQDEVDPDELDDSEEAELARLEMEDPELAAERRAEIEEEKAAKAKLEAEELESGVDENGKKLSHKKRKELKKTEAKREARDARREKQAEKEAVQQSRSVIAGASTVAEQVRLAQEAAQQQQQRHDDAE